MDNKKDQTRLERLLMDREKYSKEREQWGQRAEMADTNSKRLDGALAYITEAIVQEEKAAKAIEDAAIKTAEKEEEPLANSDN